MANTAYAGNSSRPHWGGATSAVDQHLEVYQSEVDTRFQYMALFRGLSQQRSVADRSNTYRIDRLNSSQVMGRTSGVKLEPQKVTSDKLVITVDTVMYIRNPIDYQDDWTAPDFLTEMGMNNGTAFAEAYDQAHLIQVIKSDTILTCSDNWPGRRSRGICWDTPCKSDGTTPSKIFAISRPQCR